MPGRILNTQGKLSDLVSAIEMDLIDIRENLDMHQFCSYWGAHDIFSYIADCVCLVHGTVGCMANRRFLPVMGSAEPCDFAPQYSTNFTERDVIFGGEVKLEQSLREIEARHSPKLIAVITNCCVDIIGDDVAGVVRSVQEVNQKAVWLHTGGFSGKSYRHGSEEALGVLARLMDEAPAQPVRPGTVNIFTRRWIWGETQESEIAEAIRIMRRMGLSVNQVMRKGISLDDFISLKAAEANVATCYYFGMALFEEMGQRFGTKQIKASTPIGLDATLAWIDDVRHTMNLDYDPNSDSEIDSLRELREQTRRLIGSGRHALIWTQTGERMIGMTRLAIDLGLTPIVVGIDPAVIRDKIKMFRKEVDDGFNPTISAISTVDDVRELARCLDNPIIFCNDDFFPEYPVFKYRFAQNQVYGLEGARRVYAAMRDALVRRRSRYSFTSQVVPA